MDPGARKRSQFFGQVPALQIQDSILPPRYFAVPADTSRCPANKCRHLSHRPADHEIEFPVHVLCPDLKGRRVPQAKPADHILYHPDLFTDSIHQGKFRIREEDGQGDSREAPAGPHVEHLFPGQEGVNPGNTEGMQDVAQVELLDVLSGNHVYFLVPIPV